MTDVREKVAAAIESAIHDAAHPFTPYAVVADAAIAAHLEALGSGGHVVVALPEPYPDDTEFPYWVPERGQQVRVAAPGLVGIEMTAKWRNIDAETARALAGSLLAAAKVSDELEAQSFPCVVDDCPQRFVTYDALNRHSRVAHVQSTSRYPGADTAGDFRWFEVTDREAAESGETR